MRFFSGFCLAGEEELFDEYLPAYGSFVSGFSYGAQKALRYAITDESVKKLILLSPAFYSHKEEAFKEAQIAAFVSNPKLYALKLLKKSGLKDEERLKYEADGTKEELTGLLYFEWMAEDFKRLIDRGVSIEVFAGLADKVVEQREAAEFFMGIENIKFYRLENKNHILR